MFVGFAGFLDVGEELCIVCFLDVVPVCLFFCRLVAVPTLGSIDVGIELYAIFFVGEALEGLLRLCVFVGLADFLENGRNFGDVFLWNCVDDCVVENSGF